VRVPVYEVWMIERGKRKPTQIIDCDTDAEALFQASALVEQADYEVRQGDRIVGTVLRHRPAGKPGA
jgi:hypothetical protein